MASKTFMVSEKLEYYKMQRHNCMSRAVNGENVLNIIVWISEMINKKLKSN